MNLLLNKKVRDKFVEKLGFIIIFYRFGGFILLEFLELFHYLFLVRVEVKSSFKILLGLFEVF